MLKSRLHQYLLLLLLTGISSATNAQFDVLGHVYNAKKEPIPNAIIVLKDSANTIARYFGISNTQGAYRIKVPSGNAAYWLQCNLLGYRTVLTQLPLPNNNTVSYNISLEADTTSLPSINVLSISPITTTGDTTTFRVDAFKSGSETNVGELLNALPGFSVINGRISYNGKSVSTVLMEDDDLFGSDYTTITQNLSPKGIEKIQLIQNYNDKTYLANRLEKGKELAVNIKYNKKYLYKLIVSNEMGMSIQPSSKFYKIRQNLVSLIPKIKSVTTTNFNSTGLLATEILGQNSNIAQLLQNKKDAVNFDLQARSADGPVTQNSHISSLIVPKNRMVQNNSMVITNNLLFKPSKNLQAKFIAQYYRDVFQQQQEQRIDYAVSGNNILIQQQQFLQIKLPVTNLATEIIYSPSTYSQLIYKANFSSYDEKDSLNDIRQLTETRTLFQDRSRKFKQQLGWSCALDSNLVLDIRAFHSTTNSNILPTLFPAYIYDNITMGSGFQHLRSSIQNGNREYIFQAKLTGRTKKSNWWVELLQNYGRSYINSGITLVKTDSTWQSANPALMNQAVSTINISSLAAHYSIPLAKGISLSTIQRIEAGHLRFRNPIALASRYTNYLPSLSLAFTLKNNNRINISADMRNTIPVIADLSAGYLFTTGNTVTGGSNEISTGLSSNLTITYSFSEMNKRKYFGHITLFNTRTPLIYLTNTSPTAFYTLQRKLVFNRHANMLGSMALISKYFRGIKSQLDLSLNTHQIRSFYSTDGNIGTIRLASTKLATRIKTLISKSLTSSLSVQYTINLQRSNKGTSNEIKGRNHITEYNAELSYRFTSRLLINSKFQYIQQKRESAVYGLNIGELLIKYIAIKDKLSFMFSGNNLFNGGRFTAINFTQNSINTQSINLIPSFWMLHMSLEL